MDKQSINGIVIAGVFHRLVKCDSKVPCDGCSLQDRCISENALCYICDLFDHRPDDVHFVKYGEMAEVRCGMQNPKLN